MGSFAPAAELRRKWPPRPQKEGPGSNHVQPQVPGHFAGRGSHWTHLHHHLHRPVNHQYQAGGNCPVILLHADFRHLVHGSRPCQCAPTTLDPGGPTERVRQHYRKAVSVHDRYAEAQQKYIEVSNEVLALRVHREHTQYTNWVDELCDSIEDTSNVVQLPPRGRPATVERSRISEEYLSNLQRSLQKAEFRLIRYTMDWKNLVDEAARDEDIVNSHGDLKFRRSSTRLPPNVAHIYYSLVEPWVMRLGAVFGVCYL